MHPLLLGFVKKKNFGWKCTQWVLISKQSRDVVVNLLIESLHAS